MHISSVKEFAYMQQPLNGQKQTLHVTCMQHCGHGALAIGHIHEGSTRKIAHAHGAEAQCVPILLLAQSCTFNSRSDPFLLLMVEKQ